MAGRGADGAGGEAARHRKGWRGSGRLLLCCPLGIGAEFNSTAPVYTFVLVRVFASACGRMQRASLQLPPLPFMLPLPQARRAKEGVRAPDRRLRRAGRGQQDRRHLIARTCRFAWLAWRRRPHVHSPMALPQVHASLRTCMHMQCCLLRAVIVPAWGVGHHLLLRAAFQSSIRCA